MKRLFRNILTTVLLAFWWVAPLWCFTPEQELEMFNRIDSLYEAGMATYKQGEYGRTASLLQEAVSLQQQLSEDDDLLAMLTTLAAAQSQAGNYQAALTTTDNSIALAKRLKGDGAPELTQLENNRAYLQAKIDMPVEERVEIVRHTVVQEIQATTAQQMFADATGAYRRGACDSAWQMVKQAVILDTLRLIYDEDISTAFHNIAACRIDEARAVKNQGEYNEALRRLQAIINDLGDAAPKKEIESEMASCHSMNGDYEQAIAIYSRLHQQDPTNSAIQNNLALCYARIGDYQRSLAMQEQALRHNPHNPELLTNIATTYFQQGNYAQALQINDRAAEILRNRDGENSATYASSLVNKAACLAMMNYTDDALATNEQALRIQQQTLGANHITVATTLNNIADCQYRRMDYQQALESLQQAAQIRKDVLGEQHPDYINTVNNIATCYLATGDRANYAKSKQACLDWMLRDVRQNFTWLTEQQRQLFVQQRAPLLEGIVASSCPDGLQYDKQLLTKGLLLSSAVELERIMHESNDTVIVRLFGELRTIRLALDGLYAQPADAQDRGQIESLNRQAESLEQQLLARSQEYGNLTRSLTYHWQDVQRTLKEHEIAIEFAKAGQGDDARYVALVLRKGWSAPKCVSIGKQADYAEYIQKRFRAYEYEELGNAVWHDVLAAAEAKDGEVIYFSPDGFLYQMGIEYLTADGKLMNDAYKMYRLSSTRMLCERPKHTGARDMTLFGGLLYGKDNTKGEMFQYLPATLKEVQNISALYPGSRTITGGEGTEEAFYAMSGHSPTQLHIATHGFYIRGERAQEMASNTRSAGFIRIGANTEIADNSMSRTGLLLCGAEAGWTGQAGEQHNDGVLTAREIMLTDLHNTELAVLSACQTGMGDIEADGVAGLQRGLKKAGVQTMMISLWDVNDEATGMLMISFYEGILQGKTQQQALRDAQERVRTYTGRTAQAQRAIEDEEAYMAEIEDELSSNDRAARPLKFLRQNNGQNSTNTTAEPEKPKIPYAAPRYWAAFILLDAL
ncbi:MAG: CHAT domain-containing protein [Paludibacteraceae bacterium]|nr:CHAT domain-containing protein [Paludibacteraceae bacterium]